MVHNKKKKKNLTKKMWALLLIMPGGKNSTSKCPGKTELYGHHSFHAISDAALKLTQYHLPVAAVGLHGRSNLPSNSWTADLSPENPCL